jgi:hypothetical protein
MQRPWARRGWSEEQCYGLSMVCSSKVHVLGAWPLMQSYQEVMESLKSKD